MTEDPLADAGAASERLQRYLTAAGGLTRTTLGTTERLLAGFVRSGEVAADHAERLLDEVVARSVEGSGALARLVVAEVDRAIERTGLVRRDEVERLRDEVGRLRVELDTVRATARQPGTDVARPRAEVAATDATAQPTVDGRAVAGSESGSR